MAECARSNPTFKDLIAWARSHNCRVVELGNYNGTTVIFAKHNPWMSEQDRRGAAGFAQCFADLWSFIVWVNPELEPSTRLEILVHEVTHVQLGIFDMIAETQSCHEPRAYLTQYLYREGAEYFSNG